MQRCEVEYDGVVVDRVVKEVRDVVRNVHVAFVLTKRKRIEKGAW